MKPNSRATRGLWLAPLAATLLILAPTSATASVQNGQQAADPIPLPLSEFSGIEVTAKHIFVAGGRDADGIVVTDNAGGALKKIPAGAGATDIVLSRDGRTLYAALPAEKAVSASPYYIKVYSGRELTPSGLLQPMPYPVAVAVTSKGDRLAAAGVGYNEPDVYLFKTGDGTLLAPPTEVGSWLQPRGLAWSPNGKRLFGVVGGSDGQNPRLLVLAP